MSGKIFKTKGMHCASCASTIERTLKKIEGVSSVSASYGNESVSVESDI